MEPRITQATPGLPEPLPLGASIDAIELTDEDLEKVIGTSGDFGGFGFHRFHRFHHFPFRHFNNGSAIAITNVAIAG